MRKSLGVSWVTYEQGDLLGKLLALITLMPIYQVSGMAHVILARREIHTVTWLMGLVFSTIINMIAKRIIREPRPDGQKLLCISFPSSLPFFSHFIAQISLLSTNSWT
jgi:dolichyldiphosphatase